VEAQPSEGCKQSQRRRPRLDRRQAEIDLVEAVDEAGFKGVEERHVVVTRRQVGAVGL
jgi:hypothetical protein